MQSIIAKLNDASRDDDLTMSRAECLYLRNYTAKLPEPQRTILLSRQDGMTPSEIAGKMKMDVDAVRRILAKIYADLRVTMH